jgi:membrane protease YdiL (CAAX protease family)
MKADSRIPNKPGLFHQILHFPLVHILIAVFLVNVPTFILRSAAQILLTSLSVANGIIADSVVFLVRLTAVYTAYGLFVKFFEKREPSETRIDPSFFKELGFGFLLGFLTISGVLGALKIAGGFSITGIQSTAPVFQSALTQFFYAFLQDVVYFAIIFRIFENKLGSLAAVLVAAGIFGFKHLLFPGFTIWSAVAQTLEAGILFSSLFLLTRRIWLIFGFHFTWNFIQYGILGYPEFQGQPGWLRTELSGPDILTGSPVGLEASILTFCAGLGLGLLFLTKARQKGNVLPPCWRRASPGKLISRINS